jgi:hypothetical protein
VFCPWLGPDQFAAWLGAELFLNPRESTSWSKPFVEDWNEHPQFAIVPENRWWRLYLEILNESARVGRNQWVTGYPDLHTAAIHRAMTQMTSLWKAVVDTVSEIILPTGQGTSNWTMGWSRDRFLCIGQNDFTGMIGPGLFDEFCGSDNRACCRHVDRTLYHLDGPGAIRHVPGLLVLEDLHCIQWIQGAGQPLPSKWLPLLRQIQAGGKSVQLYYGGAHGGGADLKGELDILCSALDPNRLFLWAQVETPEQADAVAAYARSRAR